MTKFESPTLSELSSVFINHYTYHKNLIGENALRDFNEEQHLISSYDGRVTYELIQNAIDRADKRVVVVLLEDGRLLVGNDGRGVTVDPNFEYEKQHKAIERPDFNGLCSSHTSNKSPNIDMGNKGVGFKSVFSTSNRVQVWSCLRADDKWWGVELLANPSEDLIKQRINEDALVEDGINSINVKKGFYEIKEALPSFYFPLPLLSKKGNPFLNELEMSDLATIIMVPVLPEKIEKTEQALTELLKSRLHFVGVRDKNKRELKIKIDIVSLARSDSLPTWPNHDTPAQWDITWWKDTKFTSQARLAGLEIDEPGVALAWPPENPYTSEVISRSQTMPKTALYCYLPTQESPGIQVDLHADFQLDVDRKSVKCDDSNRGNYNGLLLQALADIHIIQVYREVGLDPENEHWSIGDPKLIHTQKEMVGDHPREDLWELLTPEPNASAFVEKLRISLFGSDSPDFRRWTIIAKAFFDHKEQPLGAYQDFWQATNMWIQHVLFPRDSRKYRKAAIDACEALRSEKVLAIPLTPIRMEDDEGLDQRFKGFKLPDRLQSGEHDAMVRLFLRSGETIGSNIDLPEALIESGRAITAFTFPGIFNDDKNRPTGAIALNRWAVLSDLRQLPGDLQGLNANWNEKHNDLDTEYEKAVIKQLELIRFAAILFQERFGPGNKSFADQSLDYHVGWRGVINSPEQRRGGRAIATLFLPTSDGMWEPARQMTRDRIDYEVLETELSLMDSDNLESFFTFLGVNPAPPLDHPSLIILEDGANGYVSPVTTPPSLIKLQPGGSPKKHLLKFLSINDIEDTNEGQKFSETVFHAWQTWLSPLVEAELTGQSNISIHMDLATKSWFPVKTYGYEFLRSIVAPNEIVLHKSKDNLPKSFFHAVSLSQPEAIMLEKLNAVNYQDDSKLRNNYGEPARRLLDHLKNVNPLGVNKRMLIAVYQLLFKAIVQDSNPEGEEPFPLLIYKKVENIQIDRDREIDWATSEKPFWIALESSESSNKYINRNYIRDYFPSIPLLVASAAQKKLHQIPWLSDQIITLASEIKPDVALNDKSTFSRKYKKQIFEALPSLLALAEATGGMEEAEIDSSEIAKQLNALKIIQVSDAWVNFTVSAHGLEEQKPFMWRYQKYRDVIVLESEKHEPRIIFDVVPGKENDGLPSLSEFGEPLARIFLNGPKYGDLFSKALGSFEGKNGSEKLEELLQKAGAVHLKELYNKQLSPLSSADESEYLQKVIRALGNLGVKFRKMPRTVADANYIKPSLLMPMDKNFAPELNEENIQNQLDEIAWSEKERPFIPTVIISVDHFREWQKYLTQFKQFDQMLDDYSIELLAETNDTSLKSQEIRHRMNQYVRSNESPRLAFRPDLALSNWLKSLTEEREDEIPEYWGKQNWEMLRDRYTEFKPPSRIVEPSTNKANSSFTNLSQGEMVGITQTELNVDNEIKSLRGFNAEVAFLSLVAHETNAILLNAKASGTLLEASSLLLNAVPKRGTTWNHMNNALQLWEKGNLKPETLHSGLHISKYWGNAGFDILGLEHLTDDHTRIRVVRYECKALQKQSSQFRLFLSRNELNLAKHILLDGNKNEIVSEYHKGGYWRLIGVLPQGQEAQDLTSHLKSVMIDWDKHIRFLYEKGMSPNGLVWTGRWD